MAFPSQVLEDIQRGKSFLSELDAEDSDNLEKGCQSCSIKNYYCLSSILNSLEMKVALDQYDDDAIALYGKMLIIIGDYTVKVPPTVDAGPNQSLAVGGTAEFNPVIVEGSSPIASILWTIVSGSGTLINPTTANASLTGYPLGGTVVKITVTATDGLKASDTLIVTGIPLGQIAYWGIKAENGVLSYADIIAGNQVSFANGGDISIPFYTGPGNDFYVLWFAYASTQPTKNTYTDITDPNNNGSMVSNTDFFGGPTVVAGATPVKYHETNFPTQYKPVNTNRGFIFKTE